MAAEILAREIANLRVKEQTTDTVRAIEIKQWSLDRETEAETKLWAFLVLLCRRQAELAANKNPS